MEQTVQADPMMIQTKMVPFIREQTGGFPTYSGHFLCLVHRDEELSVHMLTWDHRYAKWLWRHQPSHEYPFEVLAFADIPVNVEAVKAEVDAHARRCVSARKRQELKNAIADRKSELSGLESQLRRLEAMCD